LRIIIQAILGIREREVTMLGASCAVAPDDRTLSESSPEGTADVVGAALVGFTIADIERALIIQTLAHYAGNRTRAASVLGVSVRTLRNKINEYVARGIAVTEPNPTSIKPKKPLDAWP
jgi:two-component system, response regulator FlrC